MSGIHVERGGSGEPLVLLHGVGHRAGAWAPVRPALEARFDVIACDSPGFGSSERLPAGVPRTIPAYADAFAAFLAEQGIERPHVAGNSMGGAIALELGRRGIARSVTAFSPAGFWGTPGLRWCQGSILALDLIPGFARPAVRAALRSPRGRQLLFFEMVKRGAAMTTEAALADLDGMWNAPSLRECLAGFAEYRFAAEPAIPSDIPVCIAWGDADRLLTTATQSRRARRLLPNAAHLTIDGGHLPYTDTPSEVVAAIVRTAMRAERSTAPATA